VTGSRSQTYAYRWTIARKLRISRGSMSAGRSASLTSENDYPLTFLLRRRSTLDLLRGDEKDRGNRQRDQHRHGPTHRADAPGDRRAHCGDPGNVPAIFCSMARLLSEWIASIGLDPSLFGTLSLRRTRATLIYKPTGNTRAGQLLLGHRKSRARSGTSASRLTAPLPSPSRSTSEHRGRAVTLCPPLIGRS